MELYEKAKKQRSESEKTEKVLKQVKNELRYLKLFAKFNQELLNTSLNHLFDE